MEVRDRIWRKTEVICTPTFPNVPRKPVFTQSVTGMAGQQRVQPGPLTHAFDVQRVHNRAPVLVSRNGPLKGLLFHNLAALLVLQLGILVIRLHLHHLARNREGRGVTPWRPIHLAQRSNQGHCDGLGLHSPGLRKDQSQTTQGLPPAKRTHVSWDSVFTPQNKHSKAAPPGGFRDQGMSPHRCSHQTALTLLKPNRCPAQPTGLRFPVWLVGEASAVEQPGLLVS